MSFDEYVNNLSGSEIYHKIY